MKFKYNAKQLGIIVGSLAVAFVINWIAWWLIMGKPTDIDTMYHILVTICLGSAFIVVGDAVTKAEIFK
jgi:Na+/proline symporter